MFTSEQTNTTTRSAKSQLKAKGWSYRRAARVLGRSYQHVSEVLNGRRTSQRLLNDIAALPPAQAFGQEN